MSSKELKSYKKKDFGMVSAYTGKTKSLLSYVDMLEKTNKFKTVVIHHDDYSKLKNDFKSLFRIIKASGGVVKTENGKVLMIFRRGHWDLPKGKIDLGEKKRDAAVREVMEETGISKPVIKERICKTHHCYRLKSGVRAFKITYWYKMESKKQPLVPEESEDIEKAKWVNPRTFITKDLPIFANIVDVLKEAGEL